MDIAEAAREWGVDSESDEARLLLTGIRDVGDSFLNPGFAADGGPVAWSRGMFCVLRFGILGAGPGL